MSTSMSERIDAIIVQQLDFWLDKLAGLVNQPSISSQGVGMEETAEMVAGLMRECGFEARIMPTDAFPIVYAEAPGRSEKTLLCYNHYDVQPPEPLELWDSPPFEATRRGNQMFGRGIQDDKGAFISRLAAISAVKEALGGFPCRIKFVIEGGEEISSPFVPEFVDANRELLKADACVWETGGVDYEGRPRLVLGLRGICYVQFNVRTMNRDTHSGGANLMPNAAWRLLRALATIKDENEVILVDGFYDDVLQPREEALRLLEEEPDESARAKESAGIDSFVLGIEGSDARKAVYSPTANICGLDSGYQGPGSKTVTPATATAKMDFRLVPNQDPVDIFHKVQAHLKKHGFDDVTLEYVGGEGPGETPVDDPFVQMTAATAEEVYGMRPVISPMMGGSGPIAPFRDYLKVPVVTLGISHPESLAHAPNEHILIDKFVLGTKHMARLVERFAEQ